MIYFYKPRSNFSQDMLTFFFWELFTLAREMNLVTCFSFSTKTLWFLQIINIEDIEFLLQLNLWKLLLIQISSLQTVLFILNCNQAPLSPTFLTLIRKLMSEYWSQIHALFYLGFLSWEPSWVICKFWWQQGLYNLPVRLSLIEDIFSGTEVIARPQPEGQLTDQVRPTLLCVQLLSHRISFILYSIPHIYHTNISHWQYIQCTLYISRKYHSLIQYTLYGCTPYISC